jgi:hypothetical protein
MRQRWYALNVIAPITLLFHKRRKQMPNYTVVFVSYGYVNVEADNQDDAIAKAHEESTWDHFDTPEYIRVEENADA